MARRNRKSWEFMHNELLDLRDGAHGTDWAEQYEKMAAAIYPLAEGEDVAINVNLLKEVLDVLHDNGIMDRKASVVDSRIRAAIRRSQ